MRLSATYFLIIAGWILSGIPWTAHADPASEPEVSAKAAALIDVDSNRILYEKNAKQPMRIASLTKIMTAIVAIENGDLDEKVTVGPRAVGVEGSSIYLKHGERIPLEHLLYGLMLRSGNDAAVAIAEHIGGSLEGFVYMMNEKAGYLGLEQTHFQNPHGLDAPGHVSSAGDMAKLTAYALKNPTFQRIVSSRVKTVPWPGEEWHRKWYNKNKMLRLYPGADGVKTGYTKLSKRTLVSSATRNGRQLVAVTLNASDDWNDSMRLLEYGFTRFTPVRLVKEGEVFSDLSRQKKKSLAVVADSSFSYPLRDGERKQITVKPFITHPLSRIEGEGIRVGTARIYLDEQPIGSVPLEVRNIREESIFSDWFSVLSHVFGREETW